MNLRHKGTITLPAIIIFALGLIALAGCSQAAQPSKPTPSTGSVPTATASITPSPTPLVNLQITDTVWIESSSVSEAVLLGKLVNLEAFAVQDIVLSLHPMDPGSQARDVRQVTPIPAIIPPTSEALFYFTIAEQGEFELSYSAQPAEMNEPPAIETQMREWQSLPDGRQTVSGAITNLGDHLLRIKGASLLLLDHQATPLGVVNADLLFPSLAPGSSSPFSATHSLASEPDMSELYVDVSPELLPPSAPLNVEPAMRYERRANGVGYYLAEVTNGGVTGWRVVLNVGYSWEGEYIGLDSITVPFPIRPDERLLLVVDPSEAIPHTLLSEFDVDQITVELHLDPWKTLPEINPWISLPIRITQVEQIGNRLYFRGVLSNPHEGVITESAVRINVMDVFGRIRTVGWAKPPGPLGPGEAYNFDLNVPLPEGVAANLVEYDILAIGSVSEAE